MKRTDARTAGPAYIGRMGPMLTAIFRLLETGSQEAYKFIEGTGAKDINNILAAQDALNRLASWSAQTSGVPAPGVDQ